MEAILPIVLGLLASYRPYRRECAITRHRPYLFYRQGLIAHLKATWSHREFFPLAQEPVVMTCKPGTKCWSRGGFYRSSASAESASGNHSAGERDLLGP